MTDLEKRSFYSFLGLYILSSLLFILLVGYWYYVAQKRALESETHYRLEHLADRKAGEIIIAHMHGTPQRELKVPDKITMALIDTRNRVVEGRLIDPKLPLTPGYFHYKGYNILVSDAPKDHLNIRYVVLQTTMPAAETDALRKRVMQMMALVFSLVAVVAWILARIFMRPVHQRVAQIERFINDVTHELNTPISSLSMATEQALTQGACTPKTLKNISVSTRQLYDIYRSLTYLNFSSEKQVHEEVLDLEEEVMKSIAYYTPLAEIKEIRFEVALTPCRVRMPASRLALLFGNLIGNAIKYSHRGTAIKITLKKGVLYIRDHGIGIDASKQHRIFEKYQRATAYSGGFGVGLSIVRQICETYGIGIEVSSEEGKGTEFRLYFDSSV